MTQHQLRTPSKPVRPSFARRLPQEASEHRRGVEHGQTAELQLLARPAAPLVVRDYALALGAVRQRLARSRAAASSLLPSPRPPAPSCASLRRRAPKVAHGRRLMVWLRSHAVATPSAGRPPSNSGCWRLGSRRRALAATHPWLRAKENCISQSPRAERVAARWLFGGGGVILSASAPGDDWCRRWTGRRGAWAFGE